MSCPAQECSLPRHRIGPVPCIIALPEANGQAADENAFMKGNVVLSTQGVVCGEVYMHARPHSGGFIVGQLQYAQSLVKCSTAASACIKSP
jgi:hypothetical protein